MENRSSLLTIRIRRDADCLLAEIPGLTSDPTIERGTASLPKWTDIESSGVQIKGIITETNLQHGNQTADRRLVEAGEKLFQTAFPSEVREHIRSSAFPYLIIDLNAAALEIPWELAHDGTDFLGCRFSVGRKVQEWAVQPNLPFESWPEVLGSERLTGALLDRLTHRVHILEVNGESYRLRDAKKRLKQRSPRKHPED